MKNLLFGVMALTMLSAPAMAYTPLEDVTLCGKIATLSDGEGWTAYELRLEQPFTPQTEGYNDASFTTTSIFIDEAASPAGKNIAELKLAPEDSVCVSGQLMHASDDTSIDFNTRKPMLIRKQTAWPDPETSGTMSGEVSKIFLEYHICFIEVQPDRGKAHVFEISYGDRAKYAEYLGNIVDIQYKHGELVKITKQGE